MDFTKQLSEATGKYIPKPTSQESVKLTMQTSYSETDDVNESLLKLTEDGRPMQKSEEVGANLPKHSEDGKVMQEHECHTNKPSVENVKRVSDELSDKCSETCRLSVKSTGKLPNQVEVGISQNNQKGDQSTFGALMRSCIYQVSRTMFPKLGYSDIDPMKLNALTGKLYLTTIFVVIISHILPVFVL